MATSSLRPSERFGTFLVSLWRFVMAVICGACAGVIVDGLESLAHLLRIHRLDLSSLPLLLLCVGVLVAFLIGTLRFSELLIDPRRKVVFMAAFLAAVFVSGYFFGPAC